MQNRGVGCIVMLNGILKFSPGFGIGWRPGGQIGGCVYHKVHIRGWKGMREEP